MHTGGTLKRGILNVQGPVFELVFSGGSCTQDPDTGKCSFHTVLELGVARMCFTEPEHHEWASLI